MNQFGSVSISVDQWISCGDQCDLSASQWTSVDQWRSVWIRVDQCGYQCRSVWIRENQGESVWISEISVNQFGSIKCQSVWISVNDQSVNRSVGISLDQFGSVWINVEQTAVELIAVV